MRGEVQLQTRPGTHTHQMRLTPAPKLINLSSNWRTPSRTHTHTHTERQRQSLSRLGIFEMESTQSLKLCLPLKKALHCVAPAPSLARNSPHSPKWRTHHGLINRTRCCWTTPSVSVAVYWKSALCSLAYLCPTSTFAER